MLKNIANLKTMSKTDQDTISTKLLTHIMNFCIIPFCFYDYGLIT